MISEVSVVWTVPFEKSITQTIGDGNDLCPLDGDGCL